MSQSVNFIREERTVLFAVPFEALEICLKDGTHCGGKKWQKFYFYRYELRN